MSDQKKVSVIIVSWNTESLLRKCLTTLFASRTKATLEIFVVDNNSADNTVKMIKKEFPAVKLIVNRENAGFAKANNQALKEATGDYILLLNPDTEIFPETIEVSINFMETDSKIGVMGPKMFFPDGRLQPSVRRFPTLWPILLMFLKVPKVWPEVRAVSRYLAVDFDYEKEQTIDQVMGAYMFIRRAVVEKIGPLDERFFIWFEEVDFCRRAWRAGYQVVYNPNVKITHYGGQSFIQQGAVNKQFRFFQSAMRYFLKNGLK